MQGETPRFLDDKGKSQSRKPSEDAKRQMKDTKLCPFCREQIPVLAQKCRYCGEFVGIPVRPERRLKVEDLGAPRKENVKMSESFIEAYASIRDRHESETQALLKVEEQKERRKKLLKMGLALLLVPILYYAAADLGMAARSGLASRLGFEPPAVTRGGRWRQLMRTAETDRVGLRLVPALQKAQAAEALFPTNEKSKRLREQVEGEILRTIKQSLAVQNYGAALRLADAVEHLMSNNPEIKSLRDTVQRENDRYDIELLGVSVLADRGALATIKAKSLGQNPKNFQKGDTFDVFEVIEIDDVNQQVVLYDKLKQRRIIYRKRIGGTE